MFGRPFLDYGTLPLPHPNNHALLPARLIIMVMIVHFFKAILSSQVEQAFHMLYLDGSIQMVSACPYFLRRVEDWDLALIGF